MFFLIMKLECFVAWKSTFAEIFEWVKHVFLSFNTEFGRKVPYLSPPKPGFFWSRLFSIEIGGFPWVFLWKSGLFGLISCLFLKAAKLWLSVEFCEWWFGYFFWGDCVGKKELTIMFFPFMPIFPQVFPTVFTSGSLIGDGFKKNG